MPDGKYSVYALIPKTSDFTLELAVSHFAGLTRSEFQSNKLVYGRRPLRAELVRAKRQGGFRVSYGDWAVVAWLDSGKSVERDNKDLAEDDDLPAPVAVIASCNRMLSVWSDEDWHGDWTNEIGDYTNELRKRFGMFILDYVNGGWWTE